MSMGRNVRIDPSTLNPESVPGGLSDAKIAEIKKGVEEKDSSPIFPRERSLQDLVWLGLFIFSVLVTWGFGIACSGSLFSDMDPEPGQPANTNDNSDDMEAPSFSVLASAIVVSGGVSFLSAMGFIFLAAKQPACVVWTSLVFGPVSMMVMGFGLLFGGSLGSQIMGGITIGAGALCLALVFCCYRDLVPFMIAVTKLVAEVIEHHPCMITVGIVGAFLGIFWTVSAMFSFAAIFAHFRTDFSTGTNYRYPAIFIVALMFSWGAGVVSNVCHVTYCGVFGRWYYCINSSDREESSGSEGLREYDPDSPTLWPSLKVAISTSLGSICCGSFLVAFVRAMQAVVDQMQQDAAGEGNYIVTIALCCLKCFINCIGDILEYFNDWAYVQCALRGVSFIEAARITLAMMTISNVKYIVMDLLLNSLVNMGSLIVALASALAGAGVGAMGGSIGASWGGILGFLIGIISGSAAMGIINSGVKTIFACYADEPHYLEEHHPELTGDFDERIGKNLSRVSSSGGKN